MKRSNRSVATTTVAALCALQLSACGAARDASADVGTSAAALVSDSAHGSGTPGFYFLPPIGAEMRYAGRFAAGLSPVVTVEEVAGRGVIATFTRGGRDDFRVKEEDRAYEAKWHVEHSGVKEGFVYRIHVAVNGVELGYADAKVARTKAQRTEARRQGFVPLDGGELMIAFRIEPEALGSVTRTIGMNGGRVCAANGACIVVPPGALDAPVVLNIEQTTIAAPAGLGAITPVYRLLPEGKVFAKPVQVILPVPSATLAASVYWTALGSTTQFDPVGGTIGGGFVAGENVHFSLVFAGAASTTRTVNGSQVVSYTSASWRHDVPTDFSVVSTEAIFQDGAGNLVPIAAVPGPVGSGTFTIPGVPVGEYTLRIGKSYLVTSSSVLDLGSTRIGRPDVTPVPFGTPTTLTFDVTNFDPLDVDSDIEMFSTEVNDWWFNIQSWIQAPSSSTTLAGVVDVEELSRFTSGQTMNEILGSRGDELTVAQLRRSSVPLGTAGVADAWTMTKVASLEPAPFDLLAGGSALFSGSAVPVTLSRVADFDYRGSDFEAAWAVDGNPVAVFSSTERSWVSILAEGSVRPAGTSEGETGATVDPLGVMAPPGVFDFRTGPLAYGLPPTGSWDDFGATRIVRRMRYLLPGSLKPFAAPAVNNPYTFDGLWQDFLVSASGPTVITPAVTPARNVAIVNGASSLPLLPDPATSITEPISAGGFVFLRGPVVPGIGLSPTIRWDPPRSGPPRRTR